MIERFTVSRDDAIYQAWPDVALTAGGRMVCVFTQCTHHNNRDYTRIMCCHSDDRGRTWSAKRPVTDATSGDPSTVPYWNCPRITALADGRLLVVVDRITSDGGNGVQTNWLISSADDGLTWSVPLAIPVVGIVPDRLVVCCHGRHAGRWLITAHARDLQSGQRSAQRLWTSDDQGATWQGPITIAAHAELFLCEGSIVELSTGELVCFLRENSFAGLDAFKSVSRDGGATWSPVTAFPLPGCHRPVAGLLTDGQVLITHRFLQGGKGWLGKWTQNTFVALTAAADCLAPGRAQASVRIMPLDYDRSPVSDCGYTGWVQFADGEIYVVNYLVDDAPKAQIRGYAFHLHDLIL